MPSVWYKTIVRLAKLWIPLEKPIHLNSVRVQSPSHNFSSWGSTDCKCHLMQSSIIDTHLIQSRIIRMSLNWLQTSFYDKTKGKADNKSKPPNKEWIALPGHQSSLAFHHNAGCRKYTSDPGYMWTPSVCIQRSQTYSLRWLGFVEGKDRSSFPPLWCRGSFPPSTPG